MREAVGRLREAAERHRAAQAEVETSLGGLAPDIRQAIVDALVPGAAAVLGNGCGELPLWLLFKLSASNVCGPVVREGSWGVYGVPQTACRRWSTVLRGGASGWWQPTSSSTGAGNRRWRW